MVKIFEIYNLKTNPFVEYSLKYEIVGRKKEWETLIGRLNFAFEEKKCRFIILQGDYGMGKTFTLEKLYHKLKLEPHVLVIPPTKLLAEAPIAAVPTEPKPKFGLFLVNKIFKNLGLEELTRILKKVDFDSKLLKISTNSFNLFSAIKEGCREAFDAISGNLTDFRELKTLSIIPIKDSDDALECLHDFQQILKVVDIENFLIMLDEFEYIFSILGDVKITQILQTFRRIFDSYNEEIAKIIFIFAISPGGYDRLRELEALRIKRTGGGAIAPFMRRINPADIISLGGITEDAVIEMVIDRLAKERVKKISNKLYPLTKDCIKLVYKESKGAPGTTLMLLSILLEHGYEKKLKKITAKDAKGVLKRFGLIQFI